jgi:hypothetical protein
LYYLSATNGAQALLADGLGHGADDIIGDMYTVNITPVP